MDTNNDHSTASPLGIIVAMGSELKMLLAEMSSVTEETANGTTYYKGNIGSRDIVAMQCGIGKVNAAVGALTLIERYSPEAIINTGIAGGKEVEPTSSTWLWVQRSGTMTYGAARVMPRGRYRVFPNVSPGQPPCSASRKIPPE